MKLRNFEVFVKIKAEQGLLIIKFLIIVFNCTQLKIDGTLKLRAIALLAIHRSFDMVLRGGALSCWLIPIIPPIVVTAPVLLVVIFFI